MHVESAALYAEVVREEVVLEQVELPRGDLVLREIKPENTVLLGLKVQVGEVRVDSHPIALIE